MTFSEAEDLCLSNIDELNTKRFLTIGGENCLFVGFIVAPENSSRDVKQKIYDQTIKKNITVFHVLQEMGFLNEPMKAYLIYQQNGREIIIPLESYLNSSNNAS